MNITYCFVSHNKTICDDYCRIKHMMNNINYDNYIIFYGGKKNIENENVVFLKCKDTYCSLPEKINYIYKYMSTKNNFDYICKLDRDMRIFKLICPNNKNKMPDYAGIPHRFLSNNFHRFTDGTYHFRKCETDSYWYDNIFYGEKLVYCLGGKGYILSKKSIDIIAKDNSYNNHVYEDYYVGSILKKHSIEPQFFNIVQYCKDS